MADTIKSSKSLAVGIEFEDSTTGEKHTSTITLPNFRQNLTESQIKTAFNDQNVLIYGVDNQGNPEFITSDNVLTAATTNQTINNLDIGWED